MPSVLNRTFAAFFQAERSERECRIAGFGDGMIRIAADGRKQSSDTGFATLRVNSRPGSTRDWLVLTAHWPDQEPKRATNFREMMRWPTN